MTGAVLCPTSVRPTSVRGCAGPAIGADAAQPPPHRRADGCGDVLAARVTGGVREVRLHDGRHTAATLLLSEGVHPRVVMEVLGHAQMRTTTDTYSHVMPALGRDAADRMGRALWD